jgi:hypothetical protein
MLSYTPFTTPNNWGYIICRPCRVIDAIPVPLPSLSLSADAQIIDTNAQVVITQTFTLSKSNFKSIFMPTTSSNDKKKSKAVEAVYRFPLPENAAVCAFECEFNGSKIVGKVKEKEEARQEYTEAIKAGKQASLLEQEKPDVFQISIGNLRLPDDDDDDETKVSTVVTRITYVQELPTNTEPNELRFGLLSKELKDRYASSSDSLPNYQTTDSKWAMSTLVKPTGDSHEQHTVQISITLPAPIRSITSPSHSNVVMETGTNLTPSLKSHLKSLRKEESMDINELDEPPFDPAKAVVTLDSQESNSGKYLDKELVVVVKADGLDKPRCVVEEHETDGTHAVSVTLVPRFALNEVRFCTVAPFLVFLNSCALLS